jgi:hypothetical protein
MEGAGPLSAVGVGPGVGAAETVVLFADGASGVGSLEHANKRVVIPRTPIHQQHEGTPRNLNTEFSGGCDLWRSRFTADFP